MDRIRHAVREHVRLRAAAYVVLMVALSASIFVYWRACKNVQMHDEARFDVLTTNAVGLVQGALDRLLADLRAVSGFFEASAEVRQAEWDSFVSRLDFPERHPGVRAVGFAQKVTADQRAQFLRAMRSRAGVDFEISPASTAPLMFPTVFVRQFPTNMDLRLGWDSYAEETRRPALDALMKRAQPTVAPKLAEWINGKPKVDGFTVFLPVEGARHEVSGAVFSSFIPQLFLNTLSNSPLNGEVGVELWDGTEIEGIQPLAFIAGAGQSETSAFRTLVPLRLADRNLTLRVRTLPRFHAVTEDYLPKLALSCGVSLSLLIFWVAWSQGNARQAAERLNSRLRQSEEQLVTANSELHAKISEARLTEELLAYERDLLNTLLEHSPDSIYFKNLNSAFIRCSKAVVGHLGLQSATSAVGRTDFDFFAEENARFAYEMEQEIIRTGKPVVGLVAKEVWTNGRETWALTSKMPLRDNQGKIIGTFGITKDISALKSIELALQEEKELLGVTLRSIADGVITTDVEGRVILFNKVAEELTGWSQPDAVGRPLEEVLQLTMPPAEEGEVIQQPTGSGISQVAHDCILHRRDGAERNVSQSFAPIIDMSGRMMGAVFVVRDITEKLKTQEKLLKASKLESIGVLAGGIAHDFNNILTVILGNISLARLGESMGRPVNEALTEAEKAALRARDLTSRLLTFARGGVPIKKTLDLAPLVRACAARALHGVPITPEFMIAERLWPAVADEAQIRQVLLNLLGHVRVTLGEPHRLDIHVLNQEVESDPMLTLQPGRYVRVSIRDHGSRLKPEQLPQIFEPYFGDTKDGNGLELATAYSIVRKHDGQIRVESISGQGTIFHVYLPAAVESATGEPQSHKRVARSSQPRRVLVMDDEMPLRELAAHVLSHQGHTVETVADGVEAIAAYRSAMHGTAPFDAVIMDLTIPQGMGGKETIAELLQIDPDIRAIVCSGYSNDPVMANFREYGFRGVVPKPYRLDDLVVALEDLFAEETEAAAAVAGPAT